MSRKNEIALHIVNRLAVGPVGAAASWGLPLEGESLVAARGTAQEALVQDRSLAGRVARDVALLFASFGGLVGNRAPALESVGLNDAALTPGSAAQQAANETISVARTIEARREGGDGSPGDVVLYDQLHEDRSQAGYDRALEIAAWGGTVTARMYTSGRLSGDLPAFSPRWAGLGQMHEVGWYPNPINAGDTSSGEAEIERWWDGTDWTDRLRIREGRRWTEHQMPIFIAPEN
ncbi:MAG TPA: DUF2510 domain-containing protein [Solirubrobacterales bacterium]|nr:DUF2510 domain-containing protein [Solirubrobacterales bacterium]